MRKTIYAALGVVTWRIGKRYMKKRAHRARQALPI